MLADIYVRMCLRCLLADNNVMLPVLPVLHVRPPGPKMYEANWLDLTRSGHIANVQCVEVWCPMTKAFIASYLEREGTNDSIKYV